MILAETTEDRLGNGQKPTVIARGAPQLISYCILIYSQTNSSPLFSTMEQRTVSEY